MRVYHDFFWVPGSRSTFPDTDPDPTGSGSETLEMQVLKTKLSICFLYSPTLAALAGRLLLVLVGVVEVNWGAPQNLVFFF